MFVIKRKWNSSEVLPLSDVQLVAGCSAKNSERKIRGKRTAPLSGILYSLQFRSHQETKMAARRTQQLTFAISQKNRGMKTVYSRSFFFARRFSRCAPPRVTERLKEAKVSTTEQLYLHHELLTNICFAIGC